MRLAVEINLAINLEINQTVKTGVPQGGVLSPVLFNLYTSDIPNPPPGVSLTTYADDMNPAASHSKYKPQNSDFNLTYMISSTGPKEMI